MLRGAGQRRNKDIGFLQSQLRNRIMGKDPASELQQRQLLGNAQRQASSMAASARPNQGGAARRQAAQVQGNLASGAVGQGQLLDMMRRRQALQQMQGLTLGLRGQDLGLAGMQMQQPTQMEQLMGGLSGLAGIGLS
jgi:hypothetical protein